MPRTRSSRKLKGVGGEEMRAAARGRGSFPGRRRAGLGQPDACVTGQHPDHRPARRSAPTSTAGKRGPGAGDFDFYRQLLFNKGITVDPIGHSDLTCINTGTGSENCTGTYFLPKGKIMVGGVIASRLFYELAVIGGTGLYDNVRGTVTVTYLGGSPAHEFLVFRLGI